jgi:hypothetical protein
LLTNTADDASETNENVTCVTVGEDKYGSLTAKHDITPATRRRINIGGYEKSEIGCTVFQGR